MLLLLDIISGILLVTGVFFGLSGAVGVFKLPNFFTRVHAASVTDSIAVILIIGGLLLQTPFGINIAKLLFILGRCLYNKLPLLESLRPDRITIAIEEQHFDHCFLSIHEDIQVAREWIVTQGMLDH